MNHLSQEQVYLFIDGVVEGPILRQIQEHLDRCERCRREVELQRRLTRAARELPLAKTSERFTQRVMSRVLRSASERSLSYRLLQNLGYVFAMMVVLGVLGYILTNPSRLFVTDSETKPSEVVTAWQSFANRFHQLLSDGTAKLNQTMSQHATTPTWKIISMTVAVLFGLALFDRFVLRKVVRQ